jgi:excisionase family DNA binding protein
VKQYSFQPEVFTIEAAAHYLGVSKRMVEYWIKAGELHTIRYRQGKHSVVRKTLLRRLDLDRFIERAVTL